MYRVSRSAVLLDGESIFMKEVEQAGLGVELSDGSTIGRLLFADDFVGVSDSEEEFINVAQGQCE